jgi:hypothetical protein
MKRYPKAQAESQSSQVVELQWWVNQALRDKASRVIGVTAGLGAGKTHGACQWHYQLCGENCKAPYSYFSLPTYQKIHDTGIPSYRKVLESLGLRQNRDFEVLKSPFPKIIYPDTGQEVHFVSAQNPERMVGVEYSHGVISEAGTTDEEAFKRLRQRTRHPHAIRRQHLVEGVPEGLNWYAELFDNQGNPDWVETAEQEYYNAARQFRRFRVTTFDNPFLPEDYAAIIEDDYRQSAAHIQSYLYGIFTALCEGGCYTNYMPTKHDIDDRQPDPHRDIYLTMDFNANPLAWISCQKEWVEDWDSRKERMIAVHNADMGSSTLEDGAVEFAAKHPVRLFGNTHIKLYGDSSGHAPSHKTRFTDYEAMRHYLRELGYRHVTIEALEFNPLQTQSVDALQRWFLDDVFFICKRCSNVRKSLIATKWKEGTKKIDKPSGETHTHFSDAAKYLAFALLHGGGRSAYSVNP